MKKPQQREFNTGSEPFALVPELCTDWTRLQQEREQREADTLAEALKQKAFAFTQEDPKR